MPKARKPEWVVGLEPYSVYHWTSRAFFAIIGSLVPICMTLYINKLYLNATEAYDKEVLGFAIAAVAFISTWLIGICAVVRSEYRELYHYATFAGAYPPFVFLLFSLFMPRPG